MYNNGSACDSVLCQLSRCVMLPGNIVGRVCDCLPRRCSKDNSFYRVTSPENDDLPNVTSYRARRATVGVLYELACPSLSSERIYIASILPYPFKTASFV